jgi:hypothetical protein
MPKRDQNTSDFLKLEHALIEANYLGFTLREFGRREDFACAEATEFVSDLLIGWARFMSQRMRKGGRLFNPPDSPGAPPSRD